MNPQVLDMHAIHTQDGNEQQPEQAHSYEAQETHYMHDQFHIHEAEEQAEYYGDYYDDY